MPFISVFAVLDRMAIIVVNVVREFDVGGGHDESVAFLIPLKAFDAGFTLCIGPSVVSHAEMSLEFAVRVIEGCFHLCVASPAVHLTLKAAQGVTT